MRTVNAFDLGMINHGAPMLAATPANPASTDPAASGGDALAAACLCGIVGGLVVGIAIVPAIGAVALGSLVGAGVGLVVGYH